MPKLEEEYIKTGLLKYVFRDLPLERIHRRAFRAAEAANCAGEQGQYWPMHHLLFSNQNNLSEDGLKQLASQLGLNMGSFESCMTGDTVAEEIRKDLQDARRAAIASTPTFLIGITQAGSDKITVVQSLSGAQSYDTFKQTLDSLLKQTGAR